MVIGVALIGVITVALGDVFIAVIITTKEIMRASPGHPPPGPVRLPRTWPPKGTIEAALAHSSGRSNFRFGGRLC